MKKDKSDFDNFSESYEQLLNDPIRNRFSPSGAHFFHTRKRDLIVNYFRRRRMDTLRLSFLDLGCGKGELISLLRDNFGRVVGCDPSEGMLEAGDLISKRIDIRVQSDAHKIPFDRAEFDFVTAVCVLHHVPISMRAVLMKEVQRVLKPGGTFAVIEHNPYNPITRLIVSRTPVDADAMLLRPTETRRLLGDAGLIIDEHRYFLYLPELLYRRFGRLEDVFARIPLGGQYVIFGHSA